MAAPVIELRDVSTRFGRRTVHERINLRVEQGEVLAVVGGSGSGKSTLLREMALLQRPTDGTACLLGCDMDSLQAGDWKQLRRRVAVLFQGGALFAELTVLENTSLPLREYTRLPPGFVDQLALAKLKLVGLDADDAELYPVELSGGMNKRAALARALALDPEILFLDEPSSGLDPITSAALDRLILQLRDGLGLTIVLVTHDIESARAVADRVVLIGDHRILAEGSVDELAKSRDPRVARFFEGRG